MSDLLQLAYRSRAVRPMTLAALTDLLGQARVINAGCQLTGMLLYRDRTFLQVLEGDADSVRGIYARIRRDPRHARVTTLYVQAIERRDFGDWQMAFHNLEGIDLDQLAGYSAFMDRSEVASDFFDDLTTARKLLLLFRARS